MKCFICDATIEKPQFDSDHQDWAPCSTCQQVVSDTLETFKDQAVFVEEEPLSGFDNLPYLYINDDELYP